ncbi:MAG TPA: MFS transporter [Dehalococcoidia bacterium]|nr:MFS transporter [Dehalococcoidia bacterium]
MQPVHAERAGAVDPRRWWTLGAMCLAMAMTFLDATIVNVALPSIQRGLSASLSDLQWVLDAYTLALAVLLVSGGRFGDLFGRKRVVLAGVAVFTLGSAMGGLAQDIGFLIAARALQGVGGAMLIPGTLSIITQSFDGPERGAAIGIWSGVSSLAIALGPVVGGVLVEKATWQSIFWVNVPVGVCTVIIGMYTVRESTDETASRRIDVAGVGLITLALLALSIAFIEGDSKGWTSLFTLGMMGGGVLLLLLFALNEARTRHALLDLRFFRLPTFSGANVAIFASTFSMFAYYFLLSLYLQDLLGYSALEAGLRLLPETLIVALVAPFAGRITDRFGPRNPLAAGMFLLAVSLLLATRWTATTSYAGLLPALLLNGIGQGLVTTPAMAAVMGSVPRERSGAASGVVNTMRQVGGLLGVAALGALFSHLVSSQFVEKAAGLGLGDRLTPLGQQVAGGGVKAVIGLAPDVAERARAAATTAFVHGFSETLYVNAAVLLIGTLVALLFVKSDRFGAVIAEDEHEPPRATEPDRTDAAALITDVRA